MMEKEEEEAHSYGKTIFGHFNGCYIMDYCVDKNKDMHEPSLKKPCIRKKPSNISLKGRRIIEIETLAR